MTKMDKESNTETTFLLKSEQDRDLKRKPKEASRARKGFILACCFMMQVVANGVGFGLGVVYVELQRVFDAPTTEAALVQSIFLGLMTAGGILYTPFIKKYGTGICVSVCSAVGCLGILASAFSTNIYMVIVLFGVVGGLGISINYFAPFITASLVFRENAGVPLVFLTTGSSIGQFIFPYAYEIFITEYGWSGAFILVTGMALHCVPAGLLVYTSKEYMNEADDKKGEPDQHVNKACRCSCDWSLLLDFKIVLILSTCCLLAATGNTEVWFLVDLMTIRGYERQTGSLFVTIIGFMGFLGRATGVLFRFKLKVPTIYHWIYCFPLICLSHVLVLKFTDYVPLLLSCLLYGYVFGIIVAQTPAVMFEASGLEKYASGIGFVNICFGAGNFSGGFIGGVINDSYGNYDPMFYLAIAASLYMCLASIIVVILMRRQTCSEEYPDSHVTKYNSNGYSVIVEEEKC